MKDKNFFFGLYCADFLVDTTHLTNEATGCYIKLLCRMFLERDCTLKLEHAHRICGFPTKGKKWNKLWAKELEPLFMPVDREGYFSNKRLLKEFNKINSMREQRSIAGKLGMRSRWSKNKNNTITSVITKAKQNNNNIELEKEVRIDKYSTVDKNKDHKTALDILNKQG
jgi:uncharacterized protein YdaU (DUF1376 family)